MITLTKTEIRWIITAMEQKADAYKEQEENGDFQQLAKLAEDNYRLTAHKLEQYLKGGVKQIKIV